MRRNRRAGKITVVCALMLGGCAEVPDPPSHGSAYPTVPFTWKPWEKDRERLRKQFLRGERAAAEKELRTLPIPDHETWPVIAAWRGEVGDERGQYRIMAEEFAHHGDPRHESGRPAARLGAWAERFEPERVAFYWNYAAGDRRKDSRYGIDRTWDPKSLDEMKAAHYEQLADDEMRRGGDARKARAYINRSLRSRPDWGLAWVRAADIMEQDPEFSRRDYVRLVRLAMRVAKPHPDFERLRKTAYVSELIVVEMTGFAGRHPAYRSTVPAAHSMDPYLRGVPLRPDSKRGLNPRPKSAS